MSGSSGTLILILWEKRGRKFSGFMTPHTMYQRPWQFSWPLRVSTSRHPPCDLGLCEAPGDIIAQHEGAKCFCDVVEDWLCSNNAEVSALII